jgi:hypothetical protein
LMSLGWPEPFTFTKPASKIEDLTRFPGESLSGGIFLSG